MAKPGFKPLSTLLTEDQALAPVAAQLALHVRLQNLFVATIPPHLVGAARVATLEGTTLIVAAANGPAATLLKQIQPRLLGKIQETEAGKVTAIRILVQPEYFATEVPPRPPKSGEIISNQRLTDLAEQLSDSPLKKTVEAIRAKRERVLTK